MATIPTASDLVKAAALDVSSITSKIPAVVGDAIKRVKGLVAGVPVEEVFRKRDLGAVLVIFGDSDEDQVLDVRMVPIRVSDGKGIAMTALQAGPENIPIHDALQIAGDVAAKLPEPAGMMVGGAIGAVAGATGLLQRLALPK